VLWGEVRHTKLAAGNTRVLGKWNEQLLWTVANVCRRLTVAGWFLLLLLLQIVDLPNKVSAGLTSMVSSAVYDLESLKKVRNWYDCVVGCCCSSNGVSVLVLVQRVSSAVHGLISSVRPGELETGAAWCFCCICLVVAAAQMLLL
jgi:hypothetical protein